MSHLKILNEALGRLSVEDFRESEKQPVVLVLDNIRSLHNVGSAFRTSDAFRLEKIYLCGITATPPHRDIHKSALGAEESVAWEYIEETTEAVQRLQAEGYTILAVEQVEGSIALQDFVPDPEKRYALVFGNEVKGVQQEVVDQCEAYLEIPQFGTKHSFNISVSIGIVLWQMMLPKLQK